MFQNKTVGIQFKMNKSIIKNRIKHSHHYKPMAIYDFVTNL